MKDEVRRRFRFRFGQQEGQALPEYCQSYLEQIRSGQSVAVHVRRGDYLDPKHGGIYEGICTREYYEEAMGRIRERWPDARFFLFSMIRTGPAGTWAERGGSWWRAEAKRQVTWTCI